MCSLVPSGREVGNAWIICRSKSYAGHMYYFNSLTGEAVWNLSETEAAKAERRTQFLQSQPGFLIEDCPEPAEAPKADTANKQPCSNMNQFPPCIAPPKVYNKQIINNCFPKSAMCMPHGHTHNMSHQFHLCNPMNPIPFNVPLAPAPNPSTWNAAPQQLFVPPTCNQPNFEDVYLHNMSNMPNATRCSGISQKQLGIGQARQKFHINRHRPNKGRFQTKPNKKEDLRFFLLKKREDQIKKKEFQVRANEGASYNSKYKQDGINPLSISIQRKYHSLGTNEEEDEQNYDDYEHLGYDYGVKKQGDNTPHRPRIRRRYNFSANEAENDEDNEWLEHSNNKNTDTNQGGVSLYPSRIKRRSYSFSANEGENNDDNVWLEDSNNKHTDTNQEDVSPYPSRIKRRSYSFSANEGENNDDNVWLEDSNNKHTDTNQEDVSPYPSRIKRRSYSFSANEGENNDDNVWLEDSNNKHTDTNQEDVSPYPSRIKRRSYSVSANEEENDEDHEWLEQTNNKRADTNQGDVSPRPSYIIRNYSFSANQKGKNYEANEWLEHSNTYSDTKGDIGPRPLCIRRKSFSANQAGEKNTDEGFDYTNDKYKDTNKSYVNTLPSLSRSPKPNEEDFVNNDDMRLKKSLDSQGDITPLERKFTNTLQVKESSGVTYIVPDSDVFLNNIDLLTDVLNSDKHFRLLVPRMIMNKIETATKTRYATLAYKALYFIHEQSDANLALIEKENEENERSDDDILNFCSQLIDQESMVLLTDDTELINNANTNNSNIHIITTARMKQLVNEDKSKETVTSNYKSNETTTRNIDLEELANMKITIDNKSNIQHDEEISKSAITKCLNTEKGLDQNKVENQFCAKGVSQNVKKACDIGVQASFELNSVSAPRITDDMMDEVVPPDSNKTNDIALCKTDEISLKHNFPCDLSPNTKISNNKKMHEIKAKSTLSSDRSKVNNRVGSICPVSIINETTLSDSKSLNKINEGSDNSSIIYRNSNRRENVTMEDSSTSVISNTTSNVDTESERAGVQKAITEADDSIVMFKVKNGQMEEALRVKADEWVSRFVQIMEEALSQLLQREPGRAPGCMPPPWTLREAVQCVRLRFRHGPHVEHAADCLLAFSRDHGDLRGNIKSNIAPHKYMELYSYGVYLIDALQGILSSNEDLLMAEQALSKLLDDIKQSHLDPGNQDSFNDISEQECEANVASDKHTSYAEVNQDDKKTEILKESPRRRKKNQSPASTPGKYNLRSQRKSNKEENRETSDNVTVTDPTRIDSQSSFLTIFSLMNTSEKPHPIMGLETSGDKQNKSGSPSSNKMDEHINSSGESTTPILNGDPNMNEPKIVRNFFKCVEFEERLIKNKTGHFDDNQDAWRYYNDDDEDEGELVINEEFTGNYENEDYYMDSDSYNMNLDNLWYNGNMAEETNLNSSLQNSRAPNANCENETVTFKLFMEDLESDILKAYSSIHDFLVRSSESLQSVDTSADDIGRMQARAEKTIACISNMCDQFKSVLTRENTNQSVFQILSKKEFEDIIVENDDKDSYRAFISKCLEDGSLLKESIELVLAGCKLKTTLLTGCELKAA
ncbi:uncharacterized protein LOC123868657 isoform X2 [Maniola jurtina]|uniref:uncharacterized protein LOC123868657 isoform X2 n=1 Tax=Maniola jurtina TaxID=191418 RepID=UPI001E68F625|nr:uncharacterized protein LOC123868657 isoform X2 [Maniola jurtina]